LLFNEEGGFINQLNQSNGLSNNTVLAVYEDADGNLWLAMDNGISVINLSSQFKVYYDSNGVLGTV
jgi:ligand-binding sensor domain-containing protein